MRNDKYKIFISLVVVVVFSTQTIAPSYQALSYGPNEGYTLATQWVSRPILYEEIGDKGLIGATIVEEYLKSPSVFQLKDTSLRNLFTDRAAKQVEVFFDAAQGIQFDAARYETIANIIDIPCKVEGAPYYGRLYFFKDGSVKLSVYSEAEYKAQTDAQDFDLSDSARTIRFIGEADESVRIVKEFLQRVNAKNLEERFINIVKARRLILHPWPLRVRNGMAIPEGKDEKERASFMLENLLIDAGVDYKLFEGVFQNNRDVPPNLIPVISEMERGIAKEGKVDFTEGSNEGGLLMELGNIPMGSQTDVAFEKMLSVEGYNLHTCEATIARIKDIFKKVAEHDLPKELKAHYDLYKLRRSQERHTKAEEYEAAAKLRDMISALEMRLIKSNEIEYNAKYYDELFDSIPGINPDKIIIDEDLSKCSLPTDIILTEPYGTQGKRKFKALKINANFVKFMHIYKEWLEGHPTHWIKDPETGVSGELWSSIIYSIAIHTVRGHFPIGKDGFPYYNLDEARAHGSRGDNYGYVNALAMMFYWTMPIEKRARPESRARALLRQYTFMFNDLSSAQREGLPKHLLLFVAAQIRANKCLWPSQYEKENFIREGVRYEDTGVTREHVLQIFKKNPHSASNEGIDRGRDKRKSFDRSSLLLRMFKYLIHETRPITEEAIMKIFKKEFAESAISWCTGFLVGSGILYRKMGAEGYLPIPITEEQNRKIEKILAKEDDLTKINGEIYEIIEPRWADAFVASAVDSIEAEKIKSGGEELLLVLETEWVRGAPKHLVQRLIQEIRKLEARGTIRLVEGDRETLAANYTKALRAKKVSPQNIVVLASKDTLGNPIFDEIRPRSKQDENKATLVGIDASNLNEYSYIRYLEMLTMAIRIALGQGAIGHPQIEVTPQEDGTFIFLPQAERLDPAYMQEVIKAQIKILHAA